MYRVFPRAFFNWCVATSLGRSVASSTWSFPILETFHIMGLTLVLGAVFVLNLTVLGVGVRAPGDILAKQMLPWGLAGLLIFVGTGVPMFMSAATSYSINGPFAVKMILLIGAIAVQVAIRPGPRFVSRLEDGPSRGVCVVALLVRRRLRGAGDRVHESVGRSIVKWPRALSAAFSSEVGVCERPVDRHL